MGTKNKNVYGSILLLCTSVIVLQDILVQGTLFIEFVRIRLEGIQIVLTMK